MDPTRNRFALKPLALSPDGTERGYYCRKSRSGTG
jgi:hypothetical protein